MEQLISISPTFKKTAVAMGAIDCFNPTGGGTVTGSLECPLDGELLTGSQTNGWKEKGCREALPRILIFLPL